MSDEFDLQKIRERIDAFPHPDRYNKIDWLPELEAALKRIEELEADLLSEHICGCVKCTHGYDCGDYPPEVVEAWRVANWKFPCVICHTVIQTHGEMNFCKVCPTHDHRKERVSDCITCQERMR